MVGLEAAAQMQAGFPHGECREGMRGAAADVVGRERVVAHREAVEGALRHMVVCQDTQGSLKRSMPAAA